MLTAYCNEEPNILAEVCGNVVFDCNIGTLTFRRNRFCDKECPPCQLPIRIQLQRMRELPQNYTLSPVFFNIPYFLKNEYLAIVEKMRKIIDLGYSNMLLRAWNFSNLRRAHPFHSFRNARSDPTILFIVDSSWVLSLNFELSLNKKIKQKVLIESVEMRHYYEYYHNATVEFIGDLVILRIPAHKRYNELSRAFFIGLYLLCLLWFCKRFKGLRWESHW